MNTLTSSRPSAQKAKLIKQIEDDTKIVKMSVNTEKNFYKEVRRFALENDMTINILVHKALKEYMGKKHEERVEK